MVLLMSGIAQLKSHSFQVREDLTLLTYPRQQFSINDKPRILYVDMVTLYNSTANMLSKTLPLTCDPGATGKKIYI